MRALEDVKHKIDALVKEGRPNMLAACTNYFFQAESFETRALRRWIKQISS
jgi:hypothetical protein